jgi:hypothetical protein
MSTDDHTDTSQPGPSAADERVHVAVAPDLLNQDHVVDREDDDTDADYEARSRVMAAVLAIARQVT